MKTDGPVGIFNPGQLEFDGCEAPRSQNQGQANDENEFILRKNPCAFALFYERSHPREIAIPCWGTNLRMGSVSAQF